MCDVIPNTSLNAGSRSCFKEIGNQGTDLAVALRNHGQLYEVTGPREVMTPDVPHYTHEHPGHSGWTPFRPMYENFTYEVVRTSSKCHWSIYRTSSKCRWSIYRTSRKRRGTLRVVHKVERSSPTVLRGSPRRPPHWCWVDPMCEDDEIVGNITIPSRRIPSEIFVIMLCQ